MRTTCSSLLLTSVNPLDDIAALAAPEKTLDYIVARGDVIVDRLG